MGCIKATDVTWQKTALPKGFSAHQQFENGLPVWEQHAVGTLAKKRSTVFLFFPKWTSETRMALRQRGFAARSDTAKHFEKELRELARRHHAWQQPASSAKRSLVRISMQTKEIDPQAHPQDSRRMLLGSGVIPTTLTLV